MHDMSLWFPIAFFIIAFAYSMVGFGGGSSYLAVLVLAGLPHQNIPPMALVCNLIVTTCGLWNFSRGGFFRFNKVLPFIVFSIPLAYIGGRIEIGRELFSILLGLSLLAVAIRMIMSERLFEETKAVHWKKAWALGLPMGAMLGFLSGLLGIGGGIFLSPLLILLRWANAKEAGASASFFILVNSIAGLFGQLHKGDTDFSLLIPLGAAVLAGGLFGSNLGVYRMPNTHFARVTAALVMAASLKLIMEAMG